MVPRPAPRRLQGREAVDTTGRDADIGLSGKRAARLLRVRGPPKTRIVRRARGRPARRGAGTAAVPIQATTSARSTVAVIDEGSGPAALRVLEAAIRSSSQTPRRLVSGGLSF